jgi:hypothetical protein
MKVENRRALIGEIMSLNARTSIKNASYFGITDPGQETLLDLKRITAQFAAETEKAKPDQDKITDLTNQIEASLRTLGALNIIDSQKLDSILKLLHD